MSEVVDSQVASIKARISQAQQEHAKAQAQRSLAEATAASVAEELQQEFGVTSKAEADAMMVSLQAQVDAEVQRVQDALDAVQGQG